MKKITITAAILAAGLLSACTTAEMIDKSQDECGQMGYAAGSTKYVECVERGFRGTQNAQNAAITGVAGVALQTAILHSLF